MRLSPGSSTQGFFNSKTGFIRTEKARPHRTGIDQAVPGKHNVGYTFINRAKLAYNLPKLVATS
jgi:hypothetical protein